MKPFWIGSHMCSRCHGHDPNCPVCAAQEADGEGREEERALGLADDPYQDVRDDLDDEPCHSDTELELHCKHD